MDSHKLKFKVVTSPMLPSVINLDELSLVDTQFKIGETNCEFNFYEVHN